jgi:hypothetical protein
MLDVPRQGGGTRGMAAMGSTVFVPISDSLINTPDAARRGRWP